MADPINTLNTNIKNALNTSKRLGELKDGNIPVKNIWDTLEWANPAPQHIPLIQFEQRPASDAFYEGDSMNNIPFTVQFICWVNSGPDKGAAETRCRNLREQLVNVLHVRRPFSAAGAARQAMRFTREVDEFNVRFAVGLGLICRGDILELAGV